MGRLILIPIGIACMYGIVGLQSSNLNFILRWILQVLLATIIIGIRTVFFGKNSSRE